MASELSDQTAGGRRSVVSKIPLSRAAKSLSRPNPGRLSSRMTLAQRIRLEAFKAITEREQMKADLSGVEPLSLEAHFQEAEKLEEFLMMADDCHAEMYPPGWWSTKTLEKGLAAGSEPSTDKPI